MHRLGGLVLLVVLVAACGRADRTPEVAARRRSTTTTSSVVSTTATSSTVPTTPATHGPTVAAATSTTSRPSSAPPRRGQLAARSGQVTGWSGSELLVWGGGNGRVDYGDGAAYDPRRRVWRPLAPSPLSARRDAVSVWTGDRLLVVGGVTGYDPASTPPRDGALYDPATDRWQSIAPAPHELVSPSLVTEWFGRFMTCQRFWPDSPDGVCDLWDPATNTWRVTGQPPNDLLPTNTAFYDEQLHALLFPARVHTAPSQPGDGTTPAVLGVYAYRPATDRWDLLATSSFDATGAAGIIAARAGGRYAYFSPHDLTNNGPRHAEGVFFDPVTNAFSPIADHLVCASPVASVSGAVVAWGGTTEHSDNRHTSGCATGAVLDTTTGKWRDTSPSPLSARTTPLVAAGDQVLIWGGTDEGDGAAYDPAADRWTKLPAARW